MTASPLPSPDAGGTTPPMVPVERLNDPGAWIAGTDAQTLLRAYSDATIAAAREEDAAGPHAETDPDVDRAWERVSSLRTQLGGYVVALENEYARLRSPAASPPADSAELRVLVSRYRDALTQLVREVENNTQVPVSFIVERDVARRDLDDALAALHARVERAERFVRDCATGYDHENDAHRYDNGACRKCNAEEVLAALSAPPSPDTKR